MVERMARGIERLVGADVRPGERQLVQVFFLNLLLLLTAYYILKVVREPLILLSGGAVSRSYARGVQAFLLMALVPVYSLLANRSEPSKLVNWVNAFFIASLALFITLGATGFRIGFAFFVWLSIFSTIAIAQFWSLANDLASAALVAVGVHAKLDQHGFAWANVVIGVVWLVTSWQIGRRYRQLSKPVAEPNAGYSRNRIRKAG